jgi:ubiquinone biosynthesis protein COQ4
MQSTTVPFSLIPWFLKTIDRLSDSLGVSIAPIVDIGYLRSLPPHTLGRAWADALDRDRLVPLTTGPRRKQLHDGVHVLTGYGTDAVGELEVQAFLLGAKFRVVHLVLGLGLMGLVKKQAVRSNLSRWQIGQRLWDAYRRGDCSGFDIDAWQPENFWNLPLSEVQAQFHLN